MRGGGIDRDRLADAVALALGAERPGDLLGAARVAAAGRFAAGHDGLTPTTVLRGLSGQPLEAGRMLDLCGALGLDPSTMDAPGRTMPRRDGSVSWVAVQLVVGLWRQREAMTLRQAAERAGVSRMTMQRAGAGRRIGDDALVRICRAAGHHPHQVCFPSRGASPVPHPDTRETPARREAREQLAASAEIAGRIG